MTTPAALARPNLVLLDHASALRQHLQQCRSAQGRWFTAAVWAERAHGLVAPRFVTTVVVATVLLALSSWWV